MSAIDVNAYDHIMRNQEKSKPRHIHVVQSFLLFQPMAGSIFPIEYWVSSKSWWHNFQRLFCEATSGCFCPSWTISGHRESFGLSKTFFGIPSAHHVMFEILTFGLSKTIFGYPLHSMLVYEQTAIAYEVYCLLWCRLVAVEIDGHQQYNQQYQQYNISMISMWASCYCIWGMLFAEEIDGHQQWTNDWHISLRMCLLHMRRYNNIQSFGFSIICLSKMKNKLRR